MGRWKAFIPIILALVVATGGSVFLYKWLQAKTAPAATIKGGGPGRAGGGGGGGPELGHQADPEMLKTVPFLKESLPAGYLSTPMPWWGGW
jgi:pilus assembly protein CpaB